jgi:hypothetical protein
MDLLKLPLANRDHSLLKILVCLLLAGLFLYNPFLAASRASSGLAVCHPASYRATVAACEIEQLAQPSASFSLAQPEFDATVLSIPRMSVPDAETRDHVQKDVEATPQTGFSSSLWFRPPPVA